MPAPILARTFPAFLGDHQAQGPLVLSDLMSPGGSRNLWVDKRGQIRPIEGTTTLGSTPTTNTGNSFAAFRWFFPYKKNVGGTVTREVIGVLDDFVNEWEIWYSTNSGVGFTFVSDRGATPVGQSPDGVQFGDTLYITVPKTEVPRAYTGAGAIAAAGGTQLAAPSVAAAATGVLSGNFQWKIVPVIASTGREKLASVASAVTQLTSQQADVTWVADADTNVGGYNAYRTTGVGKIFYLDAYINGRTTVTYRDNVDDLSLIRQQFLDAHGDAPPSGVYFCEQHKGRIWWGRTDADPRKWWWSDPGLADSVWQDRNFIDCSNAGDISPMGDVSTGATGDFENTLVIWLERSVWTVSGDGQTTGAVIDWNLRRTNAQIGTTSHRAVLRVPAGAKYVTEDGSLATTDRVTLAYFTPSNDIRLFDGENDTIISHPKKKSLENVLYTQRHLVFAYHDTKRNFMVWAVPNSLNQDTFPSLFIAWDYRQGLWYEWTDATPGQTLTGTSIFYAIELDTASAAQTLLASAALSGGLNVTKQITLFSGDTTLNGSIVAEWDTKALYFAGQDESGRVSTGVDMVRVKRYRYLDFLFDTAEAFALDISVLPPDATDTASPQFSVSITSAAWVRASLQDSNGDFFHNRGVRFRIKSTLNTGPWILFGMAAGYQVLDGQFHQALTY